MIPIVYNTMVVHLKTFLRIRQAVFWSLIFPIFLFVVFGSIFGMAGDPDFTRFLLTGVITMTIASDGLFAIGSIIKKYYNNGTIRVLQKLPFNILYYFVGVILTRFVILFAVVLALNIVSAGVFSYVLPINYLGNIVGGALLGLVIFSFIGLCVAFSNLNVPSGDKGLINMVYFVILFTSNALYPVSSFNSTIGSIANWLPMNPILTIIRGEPVLWGSLLLWLILPVVLFYYLFRKLQVVR
jgi:hypothetical protein